MSKQLMRLVNPFMKWLLSSPLHIFASRAYMLISVVGRKSGKIYTTPVQYVQRGDTLLFITTAAYTWWKNLRQNAVVNLRLRGKEIQGSVQYFTDAETVGGMMHVVYPTMTPEQIQQYKPGRVAVRVILTA